MVLLLHGFFHPSSSTSTSASTSTSSPLPALCLPLPRPSIPTAAAKTIPYLPLHVSPSGAHQWFFSSSLPLDCTGPLSSVLAVDGERDRVRMEEGGSRTRLIAQNVPWSFSGDDVRRVFEKHGVVDDVELSMHNRTRNRGLAFVTMDSEEDARNALSNLNSQVLNGRVIKVEYARSMKKKPRPVIKPATKYTVFVGNLTRRVRSCDLREFFSAFNPKLLSAEIIFQTNPRRSAGYGFASFASLEEAEAAVSTLSGKKFLGRNIRLVLGRKVSGETTEELVKGTPGTKINLKLDEVHTVNNP